MRFLISAGTKPAIVQLSKEVSGLIDPESTAKVLGLFSTDGYLKQIVVIVTETAGAWNIGDTGKKCLVWTRETSRANFTRAIPNESNPDFAYLDSKTREYTPDEQAERLKRSHGGMTTRNGWVIADEIEYEVVTL